jgi:hypothetical protein
MRSIPLVLSLIACAAVSLSDLQRREARDLPEAATYAELLSIVNERLEPERRLSIVSDSRGRLESNASVYFTNTGKQLAELRRLSFIDEERKQWHGTLIVRNRFKGALSNMDDRCISTKHFSIEGDRELLDLLRP